MYNINRKISKKKSSENKKKTVKRVGAGILDMFKSKKRDKHALGNLLLEHLKDKKLSSNYIEKILKEGANINIQNSEGKTPVYLCVERNNVYIFNLLKKYYPKYDIADTEGRTPFYNACMNGNLEMVKLLWSVKANVNQEDSQKISPFYAACLNGNFLVVHFLSTLKKEKFLTMEKNNKNSINDVKNAINKLNYHYGEYLIDFNKKDLMGTTAAHIIAMKGFDSIMTILGDVVDLNGKPEVLLNEQNNLGETPCFLAAKHGQSKVIKVLINLNDVNKKKRIDFYKENFEGCSPCYIASERGHSNIIKELSLINMDFNIPESKYGQTPCFGACKQGNSHVLYELIKHGANIHLATPEKTGSFTPFFISIYNNKLDISKILLLNGYLPKFKDFSNKNKNLIHKILDWCQQQQELKETTQQLKKISDFYYPEK